MTKREFTRVTMKTEVVLHMTNGIELRGCLHDVSMNGLFVSGELDLEEGDGCELEIPLADVPDGPCVRARGHVARVTQEGVAIEFDEVPLDSYEHLKNLVILNATDANQAEAQIATHLGLRRRD